MEPNALAALPMHKEPGTEIGLCAQGKRPKKLRKAHRNTNAHEEITDAHEAQMPTNRIKI